MADDRGRRGQGVGRVPVQRAQPLRHGRPAVGRAVGTRPRRDRDQPVPATRRPGHPRPVRGRGRVGRAAAGRQPAERDQRLRAREPGRQAARPVSDEPRGVRCDVRAPARAAADAAARPRRRVRRGAGRGVLHRLFRRVRARARRAARVRPHVRLLAAAQPASGQPAEPRVPRQPPAHVRRPPHDVRPAAGERAGHAPRRGRLPRVLRRPVHRTGPPALRPRRSTRAGRSAPAHRARAGQRPPRSDPVQADGPQRGRGRRIAYRTDRSRKSGRECARF